MFGAKSSTEGKRDRRWLWRWAVRVLPSIAALVIIIIFWFLLDVSTPSQDASNSHILYISIIIAVVLWAVSLTVLIKDGSKALPMRPFIALVMYSGVVLGFLIFAGILGGTDIPLNAAADVQALAQTVTFILGILTLGGAAALQYRKQLDRESQTKIEEEKTKIEEEKKNVDKYTRLVEMLGRTEPAPRLGAIYALIKLMESDVDYGAEVRGLFASYLLVTAEDNKGISSESSGGPANEARTIEQDLMNKAVRRYNEKHPGEEQQKETAKKQQDATRAETTDGSLEESTQGPAYAKALSLVSDTPAGRGLDFSNQNISNKNFSNRDFVSASLANANLTGTNLTSADLTNADLTNADLTNANLTNANLLGARGLTKEQFEKATISKETTKIDKGLWEAMCPNEEWPFWRFVVGESGTFCGETWRVLDVKDGGALLITQDIIARMSFGETSDWKNSAIRNWLKEDFIKREQFTDNERKLINPTYNEDVDTTDEIFLLSVDQANRYFSSDQDRIATYGGEAAWWWLRSRDVDNPRRAANVYSGGEVRRNGWHYVYNAGGVRPALWLNLNLKIFESVGGT